ncbi:hypothetical protein [Bdellovibrio reynosensis]|uniref:Uncharacterized protein n=1 Tax=Bdellovibrio reynosensis TaxID=2835041 RepID=A0ABY4CCT6_9BACT|nr:hypothetical protein [Bdellovibrio reynosensis]UOF02757.1 hypothetical protein MNR06_07310 [Bdellovibrio reynosensis]
MAISVLSQASALNPGSDLWIVPDLEKSQWTARLDWYLNFQICKSARHKSAVIPEFLNKVITETEIETSAVGAKTSAPLMISSEQLLPNKWVVILPWQGDMNTWTNQALEIWQKLKSPSLRIFLPPGQSTGNIPKVFEGQQSPSDLTVVLD